MKGDTQEKTEQPTPKKLRDARKKGSVAKSTDLVSACTFTAIVITIGIGHTHFLNRINNIFELLDRGFQIPLNQTIGFAVTVVFKNMVFIILPILAVTVCTIFISHLLQFGFIFSVETITPQFDKINPVEGFKRLFSIETMLEAIKSIVKVFLLGLIFLFVIKETLSYLVYLPNWGLDEINRVWLLLILKIAFIAALFFLSISFLDVMLQKRLFLRRNKMSKYEVIREYKDTEGNPMIKGRRRSHYQQMLTEQTMQNAKKATVIVTNPTHYAVALYYDHKITGLPLVVTKGEQAHARKIIKIAEKANVPVVRKAPIARSLYDHVQIGDYIPRELMEPVAEIIRWVFMNFPETKMRRR